MTRHNVIYQAEKRVCIEQAGIVVHSEAGLGSWTEARVPGTGGPRSGSVVGRLDGGTWTVAPRSPDIAALMATAAALLIA